MKEKIISIMVILTLVLSIPIVVEEVEAVPGNDDWGIAVDKLTYDSNTYVNVEIDTTSLNIDDYYVLYPIYNENQILWEKVIAGGSPVELEVTDNSSGATNTLSSSILLNVSGMWVLSLSGSYNGSYPVDFFWVNSTEEYDLQITKTEVTYNEEESITITVTKNDSSVACWIDLIREFDGEKIFHRYEPDGVYEFTSDKMEYAGNYTVQAYRDIDDQYECGYDEGKGYYDFEYGSDLTITDYNYSNCGPYDPPEYIADSKQIISKANEPEVTLDKNKVYWSFNDKINITFEDFDEVLDVRITNSGDEDVTCYFDIDVTDEFVAVSNSDKANISIGGWGRDAVGDTYGDNGTWHICLFLDIDGDGTEEWNKTVDFKVLSAEDIQWFWIDDDGSISTDDKDGIIPEIPDINNQPLEVKFQIIGNDHSLFGEGSSTPVIDFGRNITISGCSLFTGRLDRIPGVSYFDGTWTVLLTPIMSVADKTIDFKVDWEGYGTFTESLSVGGSDLNGTVVKISPTSFVIDENVTLVVTVFGPLGNEYPICNADVDLYWLDADGVHSSLINSTNKPDESGKNVYSFEFNITEQNEATTTPRNIIAYAEVNNIGNGYAKTVMKPKSDFTVNISKDTLMAGMKTEFEINVRIGENKPDESDGVTIEFYDEEGELINLNNEFGSIKSYDVNKVSNSLDDYILIPGTYTIYAYNDTHDSMGHNATLVVESVNVSCSISPFIWNYDEDISATFTVKYDGSLVNGTLRIYNMKDMGSYYRVWNDTGNSALSFNVEDGKVIVHNITADTIPSGKENLTFKFRPSVPGSEFAKVDDVVQVKVADVTPSPRYISYNQLAQVEITVTGRGTLLNGVNVGLKVPGISTMLEEETADDGIAQFAFMPLTIGKIEIFVEGRETDEIIEITAWSLEIIVPSQVDEKKPFTVIIKDDDGQAEKDVTVTFNGVPIKTNANGEVVFTAPAVPLSISYQITANKDGFMPKEKDVVVRNIRELKIISSVREVIVGEHFTLTIADDEGRAVIGAKVEFNGKEYISETQGLVKLVAPEEPKNYTASVTFEDYIGTEISIKVKAEPTKTPGFELLTLVVSIGIAFVLLRKRKTKGI